MIIVYIMVGVQSALGLYMGNYFWALSSEDFRWVVLAGPLGLILGTPFTHRMNQRFDKMPSVVFGTAWYTLFAFPHPFSGCWAGSQTGIRFCCPCSWVPPLSAAWGWCKR